MSEAPTGGRTLMSSEPFSPTSLPPSKSTPPRSCVDTSCAREREQHETKAERDGKVAVQRSKR
eukprot:2332943-Pleurochrysis_carterae.AAC.1